MSFINNDFGCDTFNFNEIKDACIPLHGNQTFSYSLDEIEEKMISLKLNRSLSFDLKLDLKTRNRLNRLIHPLGIPVYVNQKVIDSLTNNAFRLTNYYQNQSKKNNYENN